MTTRTLVSLVLRDDQASGGKMVTFLKSKWRSGESLRH